MSILVTQTPMETFLSNASQFNSRPQKCSIDCLLTTQYRIPMYDASVQLMMVMTASQLLTMIGATIQSKPYLLLISTVSINLNSSSHKSPGLFTSCQFSKLFLLNAVHFLPNDITFILSLLSRTHCCCHSEVATVLRQSPSVGLEFGFFFSFSFPFFFHMRV